MPTLPIYPDADDTDGGWTNEAGGTSLFASVDETSASFSDYIQSSVNPSLDVCKLRLSDPGMGIAAPATLDFQYEKFGTSVIDLRVRLLEGSTEIAVWNHAGITGTDTLSETITSGHIAAITDVNNLYVEFRASVPLLLDGISSLGPVYSFRKLLTAYAGNCVRIRRSSDSAEQNFGFVDNVVDTAGIATFVGGGTAFIVTWYDQNGNVVDITQPTSSMQPVFIASGLGSKPTGRYTAANVTHVENNSTPMSDLFNTNEGTLFLVQTQDSAVDQTFSVATGNDVFRLHATFSDVIYWDFGNSGPDPRVNVNQPSGWDNAPHVTEVFRETGGTQAIVVDGVSLVSATRTATISSGNQNFAIGVRGSDNVGPFQGDISEVLFTKNDTGSTNRNTIRQSSGSYYGITVI